MRGVIHGWPGAGKSRVITWVIRMFKEAMGWHHRVEFLDVVFQNRVAYATGGATIHSAGDIAAGGLTQDRKLSRGDINVLFTRNQAIRWILIDEAWQIADDLFGVFAVHSDAAAVNPPTPHDGVERTRPLVVTTC